MLSVAILGGTGYTGKYLLKYLTNHSFVNEIEIYSHSNAGNSIWNIFPELMNIMPDYKILSLNNISLNHDVYFSALPHGKSMDYLAKLIANDKFVIDLSGDFRLDDAQQYESWYGFNHPNPELLIEKTYALADYPDTYYGETKILSNPGCYPTAALLSILPTVKKYKEKIISISTNSYSGTSGAGKSPKQHLLMSEMFGNVTAYKVNEHQHFPEIKQFIDKVSEDIPFSFTTHLLPLSNGIYSTTSFHLSDGVEESELINYYKDFYKNSFFVRIQNTPPNLKDVVGTNFCNINVACKDKTLIITAAIDNLIKGASGQAIQNMNKYFGWDEKTGLIEYQVNKQELCED